MRNRWNGWIGLVAVAVWALAAPPAEAAKISMKLGHIRADTSPTHKAAVKFAEVVGQKTNGDVEIKVFPNSQLGGILDMFTGMKAGSLEMVYGGINTHGFRSAWWRARRPTWASSQTCVTVCPSSPWTRRKRMAT